MLKIVEAFSGIGSQVQALKNAAIDHEVKAIVEWEISAVYAYDLIHNGYQDLSIYRHHTKESIIDFLLQFNLSSDGSKPLTERALSALNLLQLKGIAHAIERTNNLVDITAVHAEELPDTDILTYSFPCQDLSVSGHWHCNTGGIDRDANNRSTLLWEIERLLIEYKESDKELPRFLVMENVSNILSEKHIDNFNEWQKFLEGLGYYNKIYTLDARNFGIPQSRIRTYMISVLTDTDEQRSEVESYFFLNDLERVSYAPEEMRPLGEFLRLDYSNKIYKNEAIESTPTFTPSREKIYLNNKILARGTTPLNHEYARTVTTKQDRHPNSGIIIYEDEFLTERNKKYRNLTPRECFLLMGFEEESFDKLVEPNEIELTKKILPNSKLIKLAGNSIVVQVLEEIFKQIEELHKNLFQNNLFNEKEPN